MQLENEVTGLLSYPRSGNHLLRYLIEWMTATPTAGCLGLADSTDVPLCKSSQGLEHVDPNKPAKCIKAHTSDGLKCESLEGKSVSKLIFLIRNPLEVISRSVLYDLRISLFVCGNQANPDHMICPFHVNEVKIALKQYLDLVQYYSDFAGSKLLVRYEDLINPNDPQCTRQTLLDIGRFLDVDTQKIDQLMEKKQELFENCSKNRGAWDGYNSKGELDFYWKRLNQGAQAQIVSVVRDAIKERPTIVSEILQRYLCG